MNSAFGTSRNASAMSGRAGARRAPAKMVIVLPNRMVRLRMLVLLTVGIDSQ